MPGRLETLIVPENADPIDCLAIATGWLHQGRKEKAAPWLEQALTQCDHGMEEERELARIIRGNSPDLLAELDDLVISPHLKRVAYALLSLRQPNIRNKALERAGMMNYRFEPPHYLIQRVIGNK